MQTKCIEWKHSTDRNGYGQIRLGKQLFYVHRVIAAIYLDMHMLSKREVCHRCDNPKCFNPEHLFIGTRMDNIRDMLSKGRQKRSSMETWNKAENARKLLAQGKTQVEVAKILGVSRSAISNYVHRYAITQPKKLVIPHDKTCDITKQNKEI